MMRHHCLALAAAAVIAAPAAAFDAAALARFTASGACPGCDLSDAVLDTFALPARVSGPVNLRGADLRGADLNGIDLERADLRGADLRGAALDTADLSEARLQGADLSGATGSFLRLDGADLSGAKLVGFNACYDQSFRHAVLRGADLTNARVCGSFWWQADLAGAILSGADLTHGAELEQHQLDRACGNAATKLDGKLTVRPCP